MKKKFLTLLLLGFFSVPSFGFEFNSGMTLSCSDLSALATHSLGSGTTKLMLIDLNQGFGAAISYGPSGGRRAFFAPPQVSMQLTNGDLKFTILDESNGNVIQEYIIPNDYTPYESSGGYSDGGSPVEDLTEDEINDLGDFQGFLTKDGVQSKVACYLGSIN